MWKYTIEHKILLQTLNQLFIQNLNIQVCVICQMLLRRDRRLIETVSDETEQTNSFVFFITNHTEPDLNPHPQ